MHVAPRLPAIFGLLALPAVTACSPEAPSCAPVHRGPSSISWPLDPTALDPEPWPDTPFTPAAHAAFPSVTKHGAGVMARFRLVTIVTAGDPLRDTLYAFGDALVKSGWLASFAPEYGVGTTPKSVHVDGPALTGNVTSEAMQTYVRGATKSLPPEPGADDIDLLYLPEGVLAEGASGLNCGCSILGGAHFGISGSHDALAFVQRCSTVELDDLTTTASHEVAESATDSLAAGEAGWNLSSPNPPWSASPWSSLQVGNIEIADLCSGRYTTEGEYTYQRIWSNSAAAGGGDPCVPEPGAPYFSTTTGAGWYAAPPGEKVTIPFSAWSSAARDDWYIYPVYAATPYVATPTNAWSTDPSVASIFSVTASTNGPSQTIDGVTYQSLNNGGTGTLTVEVDKAARSGEWTLIKILSRSADPRDPAQAWPVGAYVP